MSLDEILKEDKRYEKHIKEIEPKLDKYLIKNISPFLIKSHIRNEWNDTSNKKDNYKEIVKNIIKERILNRRRQILVHSCIYYKFNTNVISDFEYDDLCKDLSYLQDRFPLLSKETSLFNIFENWNNDEVSGYSLPYENPKVIEKAQRIINLNRWYKKLG